MLRFLDKTITPPNNGFPYRQPETGFLFKQIAFSDLLTEVRDHRKGNNLPIGPNFEGEVEDGSCRLLLEAFPEYQGCVTENGSRAYAPGRKWNLADVRSFLHTIQGLATSGDKFVSQEEAERRAEICARCPMNRDIPECWTCGGVTALIRTIKGDRNTSRDNDLKVCNSCGCDIKTKVFINKDLMKRDDVTWNPTCWMLE